MSNQPFDEEVHTSRSEHTSDDFFSDAPSESQSPTRNISPIPVLPELAMSLGILSLVFGITLIDTRGVPESIVKNDTQVQAGVASALPPQPKPDAFAGVAIKAKGALVWDVKEQKVLFNKNADDVLPLASITKLMTALVTHELLNQGDAVVISRDAIKTTGDDGLKEGETFSLQNLTDLTLISSSNDGATALGAAAAQAIEAKGGDAEKIFTTAMNVRAKELGLSRTRFLNSTGLDLSPTESGAYGTARDVTLLMEYIILNAPEVTEQTSLTAAYIQNTNGDSHHAKNTNEAVGNIKGLIASKTGSTLLAGGNLVIAFNGGLNHPIIVSVLGSTLDGRFDDTLELVKRAEESLETQ